MKNLILLLAAFMMNFASVNGSAMEDGGCAGLEVTLTINFDNFPAETSWAFTNTAGDTIASGDNYVNGLDTLLIVNVCLPEGAEGCTNFTINDSFGDGICCAFGTGSYSLVTAAGDTLATGGEFEVSETTQIGSACIPPTCDDGVQNGDETGVDCGGSSCEPCPCVNEVTLTINFDQWPGETDWLIGDPATGQIVASGGPYTTFDTLLVQAICLDNGCYDFVIFDAFGDGICCGFGTGSYSLVNAAGDTLASGGEFLDSEVTPFCVEAAVACQAPTDLDIVELGFGGPLPRVNATWTNPEGTTSCEVRGGRISPASFAAGEPEFANPAQTQTITQTNGSTVNFNIGLYNNPNIPFTVGQRYGYDVRCACADGSGFSDWANITPESTFVVPAPPPGVVVGDAKLLTAGINAMNIFPNPAEDMLNIEIEMTEDSSVEILLMNALGQTVMQDRSSGKTTINRMDVSNLDAGIYMLTVRTASGMITERVSVK